MKKPIVTLNTLLLAIALGVTILNISTFINIDGIVNTVLYQYGLQFSGSWAVPYHETTFVFFVFVFASLLISIFLIGATIFGYKKQVPLLKIIYYLLSIILICFNILSYLFFINIDKIIHFTLYNYGLQFSLDWATPYYANSTWLFVFTIVSIVTVLPVPFLFHFKQSQTGVKVRLSQKVKKPSNKKARFTVKITPFILILTGSLALLFSILYVFSVLAFIGLGLLFWGILFTYIRTDEYTKKSLLDTVDNSQISLLNQIRQELNFLGNPIYLPPKYFKNPDTQKMYIAKNKEFILPTPKQIQAQDQNLFIQKPFGMLIVPPGSELVALFEKTLSVNLTSTNIRYIRDKFPELLIENLELVKNFELKVENNRIVTKLENVIFAINSSNEVHPLSGNFPLCSAIACALAKASGKPVQILNQEISQNNKIVTIIYRIIDEED